MNKNRTFWIIILILISNIINAQSDFRPGYYIKPNNDTIKGLIKLRGDVRNSKQCIFKQKADSNEEVFNPTDIYGYRFSDSKFYISKTISVKGVEKQLFLEYVLKGVVSLYYYIDEALKERYFLETKNGRLVELRNDIKKVQVNGRVKGVQENKKHIGVLKVAFSDCKEIQSRIDQTKLNHKSLINISKKYHNYVCNGEECIIYEKKPGKKLTFAPIISYSVSNMVVEDSYDIINGEFETINYPTIGILANLKLIGAKQQFSIQVTTEFFKNKFYNTHKLDNSSSIYSEINVRTDFEAKFLFSTIGLKYKYPKGKIRPTIAAGMAFGRLSGKVSYSSTEYVFENSSTFYLNRVNMPTYIFGSFIQIGSDIHVSEKRTLYSNIRYSSISSKELIGEQFKLEDRSNKTTIKAFNLSIGMYF